MEPDPEPLLLLFNSTLSCVTALRRLCVLPPLALRGLREIAGGCNIKIVSSKNIENDQQKVRYSFRENVGHQRESTDQHQSMI